MKFFLNLGLGFIWISHSRSNLSYPIHSITSWYLEKAMLKVSSISFGYFRIYEEFLELLCNLRKFRMFLRKFRTLSGSSEEMSESSGPRRHFSNFLHSKSIHDRSML